MALTKGRPTRYEERFCDIIELELSKGYSIRACAPDLGVSHDTVYRWMKEYPAFSDAVRRGVDRGLKYLEKILIAKTSGQDIPNFDPRKSDTAALLFILKTRFNSVYGDKQRIEHSNPDGNLKNNIIVQLPKNNREKGES